MEVDVMAQSHPSPQQMLDDTRKGMDQLFQEAKTSSNPTRTSASQDDVLEYKESFITIKENMADLQQRIMYEWKLDSDWKIKKFTKEQEETNIELDNYICL